MKTGFPSHKPMGMDISMLDWCSRYPSWPPGCVLPFHYVKVLLQSCSQPGPRFPAPFASRQTMGPIRTHRMRVHKMRAGCDMYPLQAKATKKCLFFSLFSCLPAEWRRPGRLLFVARGCRSHVVECALPNAHMGYHALVRKIHIGYWDINFYFVELIY